MNEKASRKKVWKILLNWLRRLYKKSPRFWMSLALLTSDFISIAASVWLALFAWSTIYEDLPVLDQFLNLFPFFFAVFASLCVLRGLYPGIGLNRIVELRRLVATTTFAFAMTVVIMLVVGMAELSALWSLFSIWVISLGLVPLSRWVVRGVLIYGKMWGEPVIMFGLGEESIQILDHLRRYKKLGLRPVAIVNGSEPHGAGDNLRIQIIPGSAWAGMRLSENYRDIRTAIISYSDLSEPILSMVVNNGLSGFSRLIFLSGWEYLRKAWVTPIDLGGLLGLEIRQNLLNRREIILKRALDLAIVLVGAVLGLPVLLLLFALVMVDSKGQPFYRQNRIGYRGETFRLWKFRTMVPDADDRLSKFLEAHPELKLEWESTHKLKNDPRVTRLGGILRKLSLDEIPQIWNVLAGNMSLAGPRPIVETEIEKYREVFTLYKQVKPGITGLWQVSGRNDTDYTERIRLDEYYVRNWSIWLDLYIVIRTIWVVIRRRGAY